MLIPDFRLTQQPNHVILTLRLPYAKISASEFYIQEQHFKFYLKPYLLNLKFEQKLRLSEEPERAIFDVDKHLLKVYILKNTPGEEFTNLNVISQLLSKSNKNKEEKKAVVIEVVGESSAQIEEDSAPLNPFSYGFNNNYNEVFNGLEEEIIELFSCDPQKTPVQQRLESAREEVKADFQLDHYLFDTNENQEIQTILHPLPTKQMEELSLQPIPHQNFLQILKLPKKDLILNKSLIIPSLYQILDIMFSYKYELMCMNGQFSVESPITINQTSTTLSNNVNFSTNTCKEVVIESFKRCLTYSLYSNWSLCQLVLKQVLLDWEKEKILQILINLKKMFGASEPRYYLNRIYIDDFCIFVEKVEDEYFKLVKEFIREVQVDKKDLGLGIQQ